MLYLAFEKVTRSFRMQCICGHLSAQSQNRETEKQQWKYEKKEEKLKYVQFHTNSCFCEHLEGEVYS